MEESTISNVKKNIEKQPKEYFKTRVEKKLLSQQIDVRKFESDVPSNVIVDFECYTVVYMPLFVTLFVTVR